MVISRDEVATCSNDGRICLWRVDTTSFNVTMRLNFEGSDFVYSLCSFNGGMTIASAGETTGVKVSQVFSTSGLSYLGVLGVPDFGRSGGTDYAHLITIGTRGFSDIPTALNVKILKQNINIK